MDCSTNLVEILPGKNLFRNLCEFGAFSVLDVGVLVGASGVFVDCASGAFEVSGVFAVVGGGEVMGWSLVTSVIVDVVVCVSCD